jgi:hypothetical protein
MFYQLCQGNCSGYVVHSCILATRICTSVWMCVRSTTNNMFFSDGFSHASYLCSDGGCASREVITYNQRSMQSAQMNGKFLRTVLSQLAFPVLY